MCRFIKFIKLCKYIGACKFWNCCTLIVRSIHRWSYHSGIERSRVVNAASNNTSSRLDLLEYLCCYQVRISSGKNRELRGGQIYQTFFLRAPGELLRVTFAADFWWTFTSLVSAKLFSIDRNTDYSIRSSWKLRGSESSSACHNFRSRQLMRPITDLPFLLRNLSRYIQSRVL
jgi:hypothetical protein